MTPETRRDRESMTAVCYRCFYRGPAGEASKCPACDFALIVEAAEPTAERHIEDILSRYSVRDRAPKLPGIATHHGLPGAPRPKFFAVGTVPPPHEVPAASTPGLTSRVPSTLAPQGAPAPRPTRPSSDMEIAELEATALVASPVACQLSSGTTTLRTGVRAVEILCVVLGALAAGIGAAVLHTAF